MMPAIRPQPGPQQAFLSTKADIAIYGGAAGGGKSWALLLEPLRHVDNKGFGAVIFRRTCSQIRNQGGLWDESANIYSLLDATPRETRLEWEFASGASITFAHLEYDKNRLNWQGSEIPLLCFDELTHFSEIQFFYMLSRNRSMCGVRPYVRATCNPDPDSWVRKFIDWWIDEKTGYAIEERSGVLRWMVRADNKILWFDSKQDAIDSIRAGGDMVTEPKSVTFIRSRVQDNQALIASDPGYLSNLMALPLVEREQLLSGNWNIRPAAGLIFQRHWFKIADVAPAQAARVRYWDLAATEASAGKDPDWTAGAKLALISGQTWIEDIRHVRATPKGVEDLLLQTAQLDGPGVPIWIEQEPGSSGKATADHLIRNVLQGFNVRAHRKDCNKAQMWAPLSAQAEAGNVHIVRGAWNADFLIEAEGVPDGAHDDQVDAAAGAYSRLNLGQNKLVW
jgi:predicted phage terminase large subunit-like protein